MKEQDGVIIACGLLLPREQEVAAVEESAKIAQTNEVKFVLNKLTHPPYVRLYESVIPQKNLTTAFEQLEHLGQTMVQFEMKWGEVEHGEHFVAVWGKLNETLDAFHQKVLTMMNELREGMHKEKYSHPARTAGFTPEETASLRKWGSPWAEPYVPHMIVSKAIGNFQKNKFQVEWEFEKCCFQGLLVGAKSETGEFTHSYPVAFLNE